jgi:hypothetical protein
MMLLGLSLSAFTSLHVVISVVGLGSGVIAVGGMLRTKRLDRWTPLFLVSTALTSITGFMFPPGHLLPSHIVGAVSLVTLSIVAVALYVKELAGAWRWIYIAGAVFALYLNTVVGVVQSFQKVGFLKPLAPTQSEFPFLIAQALVLIAFMVVGLRINRRFHPDEFGAF